MSNTTLSTIAKISLTSPIGTNVPTRASLAVETKGLLFLWLTHLHNESSDFKQISPKRSLHALFVRCRRTRLIWHWEKMEMVTKNRRQEICMFLMCKIYRGYYTVARRYESHVLVARTISIDIVLATRT